MLFVCFSGLVRILFNCVGEPVESNLEISVPPTRLTVTTTSNTTLKILPPSEYIGIKPIMLRLVSHKMRTGSVGSGDGPTEGLSKTLSMFRSRYQSYNLIYMLQLKTSFFN